MMFNLDDASRMMKLLLETESKARVAGGMVIRNGFGVPCEVWLYDAGKPSQVNLTVKDAVAMIQASDADILAFSKKWTKRFTEGVDYEIVAMSDETGEEVTVDEQGAIVNSIDYLVVQPHDKTRETYEAWRKKEEAKRRGW